MLVMQQNRIKELLAEASSPDCNDTRVDAIQVELSQATAAMEEDGTYSIAGEKGAANFVLSGLFHSTQANRREKLPDLFPVFALLCGDREPGHMTADIDWSLVE